MSSSLYGMRLQCIIVVVFKMVEVESHSSVLSANSLSQTSFHSDDTSRIDLNTVLVDSRHFEFVMLNTTAMMNCMRIS